VKRSLAFILACLLVLTGCGAPAAESTPPEESAPQPEPWTGLRIVHGAEDGGLVLAGEGAGEVYTLSVGDVPVYLDGAPADSSELKNGMEVEVVCEGIMESYPGQFYRPSAIYAESLDTERGDLCGLYLKVLNDLWEKDSGLNSNIEYVGVDLTNAPGDLTDGEKHAIAWVFGGTHQVVALTMSRDELIERGYLTPVGEPKEGEHALYEWKNGVLFTISAAEGEKGMKFDAAKWRSPLGAYIFSECEAEADSEGNWSYSIGSEAIS
jgi:hypothetical protein